MRVAFDISELGASHGNPQLRRGVNRVVEEVGGALLDLAREPGADLDFALTAVENSAAAADFLASRTGGPFGAAVWSDRAAHRRWSAVEERVRAFVVDTADRAAVRRAARWGLARTLPWQRAVTHRLRAFDPEAVDVYHSSGVVPFPPYVRRAKRPACLATLYDLIPLHHPEMVPPSSGAALKAMLATFRPEHFGICISQHVKDDFCESARFDPSHVFVAPLAADPARFHPCRDAAEIATVLRRRLGDAERPYLLSLCTLEPRKNVLHLIRCFARLRQEDPAARELRLVLVGYVVEDTRRQVEAILAAEKLEGCVVMPGYVGDQDLAPLYSGALAFVFPSLAEGFGLPPLEAMQCGVPVICSNRTSLPEIVGDAGLLIDPEDSDDLCAAMGRILHGEALRIDLSKRGLARAGQFSWGRCAADHLRAYRAAMRIKHGESSA